MNGAMFQMIAHGISSAGMFFLVGVIYDRVHHRDLDQFGGLFAKMPVYSGISIGIFFAGLGLPGLCGFIGEVLRRALACGTTAWRWPSSRPSVVILTAGYILWTIQRVYLGPEYKGPHGEALTPMTRREIGHRRAAVGAGDRSRRLSAGAVRLHDAERAADGRRAWPTWTEDVTTLPRRLRQPKARNRSRRTSLAQP